MRADRNVGRDAPGCRPSEVRCLRVLSCRLWFKSFVPLSAIQFRPEPMVTDAIAGHVASLRKHAEKAAWL